MPHPESINPDTNDPTKAAVATEPEAGLSDKVQVDGNLLVSMMADPDIQAVLAAKQAGIAVNVSHADVNTNSTPAKAAQDTQAQDDQLNADIDSLDVDDDIKKIIGFFDKKLTAQLSPITDRVAAIEGLANTYQQDTIKTQVKSIADKHPDFHQFRTEMAKIARATPGLDVEELYVIAKKRAGKLNLDPPSTHSERPTPTPRRREAREKKKTVRDDGLRGRKAFQASLADALDEIDFDFRGA